MYVLGAWFSVARVYINTDLTLETFSLHRAVYANVIIINKIDSSYKKLA